MKPTIFLSVPALYHKLLDAQLPQTPHFRACATTCRPASGAAEDLDGLGSRERVCRFSMARVFGVRLYDHRQYAQAAARLVGYRQPECCAAHRDERGVEVTTPGTTGRLEVRMPSVCSGYRVTGSSLGEPPDRPAERFTADGWFATGDEYVRDVDGFFHHRGRSGDMLRVSGIWVSPSEIEDPLAGTAGIMETAAVLGENAIGLAEIGLFIVLAPGGDGKSAVTAARERLAQALPHYKLPRRFEIVTDLPRTATGKVQRHKLRERLRSDSG